MPPKKTPKSKTVFFDVRAKPSGNFGVEFSDAGRDFRLGTYLTVHDAASAYDMAVCCARWPRMDLNFLEIENQADAELLVQGAFVWKRSRRRRRRGGLPLSLVPAIATWRRWREEEEDKADPSTVIPVESGSSDWGDLEEDDKGCDDPDKDKFWEQFRSSDEEFNLRVVVV
ncbi:hypothetical protein VPH35_140915 [Triticum aestivum]